MRRTLLLAVSLVLLAALPAAANLDTLLQVKQPEPLVKAFESEATPHFGPVRVVDEKLARGGKALVLREGGGIDLDFGDLPVGMYSVWVCARIDVAKENAIVPGPRTSVDTHRQDRKPLYLEFGVNSVPGGADELHRLRVTFSPDSRYEYMTRFYFHTPVAGAYRGKLSMGARSLIREVIVDFVELRNPLAGCSFRAIKQQRTRFDKDRINNLRETAFAEKKFYEPYRVHPLTETQRRERDDVIWTNFVPIDGQLGGTYYGERIGSTGNVFKEVLVREEQRLSRKLGSWQPRGGLDFASPWGFENKQLGLTYTMADYRAGRGFPEPWPFPEDGGGYFFDKAKYGGDVSFNFGRIGTYNSETRLRGVLFALGGFNMHGAWEHDLPNRYLLTGDLAAGEDASFLLAVYAYHYPALDWAHAVLPAYREPTVHAIDQPVFWHRTDTAYEDLCDAYDKLFPYIKGNERLAQRLGRFIPWLKTPDDVVKLIDTFLVQRIGEDGLRHVLYSPAAPAAAITLGPSPEADKLLNAYFTRIYLRDTLCGFPDSMIGGFSRDGLNYIGSAFYVIGESSEELYATAKLLKRYVDLGGDKHFDVSDPKRYARLAAMGESILGLYTAGGYRVGVGDVGSPSQPPRTYLPPQAFFLDTWRWTKDPRIARLLVDHLGRGDCPEKEWQTVQTSAEGAADPVLHATSGVLEGFGVARLEEGVDASDLTQKNSVMLRFGVGTGHAHPDTLDIEVYAHGLRMTSDLGGRVMAKYGRPSCMSQLVHNLVQVDGHDMNGGPKNSTGTGWLEAFSPTPGAQYVMGSAYGETHPQVSLYNRGVLQVMCAPGDGKQRTPSGYVFDVFRVAGGNVHTWDFHGCLSEQFDCNAGLQPAASEVALNVLQRHQKGTQREGVAPEVLRAVWRLRRTDETVDGLHLHNAEKAMLGKAFDPESPPKFTAVSLFGHAGEKVMVGNWYVDKMTSAQNSFPMLYVRHEGENAGSVWPALIDPYVGEPTIIAARALRVEGAGQGAGRPVALAVKTRFGQDDFLFADYNSTKPFAIEGGFTASGKVAFVSRDADGLRLLHLVGGERLAVGDVTVTPERPAYAAEIASVDYARRKVVLKQALPAGIPDGAILTIGRPQHPFTCKVDQVRGRELDMDRTASVYRGGIERIKPDGSAMLDLAPYLHSYHPRFYDGMVAVNERGKVLGRVDIRLGDRFFYTGWPASRRHLNRIDPADLTDANGDGKITVAMFCATPTRKRLPDGTLADVKPGEKMLDLEVTRVRDDGLMLWTKQYPRDFVDALGVPHPGWPYHQQIMRNERGDREWTVNMPGDTYEMELEGGALTEADLPDADGDGRRLVTLYLYGSGDPVRTPTQVYLRRVEPGLFAVRANVGFTAELPGAAASWATDGQQWPPRKTARDGGRVRFAIAVADLASGRGLIRLEK